MAGSTPTPFWKGRDSRLAFGLSCFIWVVPGIYGDVVAVHAVVLIGLPFLFFVDPVGAAKLAALSLGGQAALWALWLICLRHGLLVRLAVAPVVVALTIGTAWWPLTRSASIEEVEAERPPAKGQWREICRFDGYRILDFGTERLWLQGAGPAGGRFETDLATCAVRPLAHVPAGADLYDLTDEGTALWTREGALYISWSGEASPSLVSAAGEGRRLAKLATDASGVAWIAGGPPPAGPWGLHTVDFVSGEQQIADIEAGVAWLSRLHRYESGRAYFEGPDDEILVFNRLGKRVGESGHPRIRPKDCAAEGTLFLRPGGWVYRGLSAWPSCVFAWDLPSGSGWFDGELADGRRFRGSDMDVSPSGERVAELTVTSLGMNANIPEALSVMRTRGDEEIARYPLPLDERLAVQFPDWDLRFVGESGLAYGVGGAVRVVEFGEGRLGGAP